MGLSSSPRIFTKVMKPIFSNLRSTFGHICLSYIDDSLYIGNTATECAEATLHAVQLITRLGFNVDSEKSVLRPSQSIEFLGFIIDSVTISVYLAPRKRDKISSLCLSFLSPRQQFTIRQVASFIGKLVSAFPGVEFGPLHYRQLLADKDEYLWLVVQGILMLKCLYHPPVCLKFNGGSTILTPLSNRLLILHLRLCSTLMHLVWDAVQP